MIPVIGYQGAVLVADERRTPEKQIALSRTGLSMDRICGFEGIRAKGLDPIKDLNRLKEELVAAGKRALEKTGAQVLVLGCLSFLGLGEELEEELHVPVIDPGPAGVALAEAVVRQRLFSSKKAYLGSEDITYFGNYFGN
jgi:allantoin racemase